MKRGAHQIAWWEYGNPQGVPVLILHGGPGAASADSDRCAFNARHWRIIQLDQRGCGKSTPSCELKDNDTQHLVGDIEALREMLGIQEWVIHGGSWGITLGLLYGQEFPDRVTAFLLRAVFLCRPRDIDWLFERGGAELAKKEQFQDYLKASGRGSGSLITAYGQLLSSREPGKVLAAAQAWAQWENSLCYVSPAKATRELPDAQALQLGVLEHHYLSNGGFIKDNQLLEEIGALEGKPALIVHGAKDLCCPAYQAIELYQSWPGAELRIVEAAGHSAQEAAMARALTEAARDLRLRL